MARDDDRMGDDCSRPDMVAQALRPLLSDGEEYLVRCREGDVQVEPTPPRQFRKDHPRLYGRLLVLEEKVAHSSSNLLLPILIAGALLAIGLQVGWWDPLLGGPEVGDQLRTWWVYLLLAVLGFFLFGWLGEMLEKWAFRGNRASLVRLLTLENLERDDLVNQLQEDPNLKNVLKNLKLDSHFDSRLSGE